MEREMKKEKDVVVQKRRTHRGRVWLWFFIVILIICGATAWVLHDGGVVNWRETLKRFVPEESVPQEQLVEIPTKQDSVEVAEEVEIKPACAVIEEMLLRSIVSDSADSAEAQFESSRIYAVLAQKGCPENAQFFSDMSVRKQTIAEGLSAVYASNSNAMTSIEYLYSDEKICQTIEKRVMQNINPNAYQYYEFLDNANTYSVLYRYGCRDNKAAYSRAAIRELAIAMALQPAEHMSNDEIVTVVEVYKRLGVANLAHLVLQRLKARGYDMDFLLSLEDIIHGIR